MILNSPDTLFQTALSRQIGFLRLQLDRAATELATGRTEDPLGAVRGNNDILLRAQAVLDTNQSVVARVNVLEGRYRTASLAFESVRALAGDAVAAAQSAGDLATGVDADRFAENEARSSLASIFSSLETRFGGRSLFGGDLGSGQVLADVSVFFNDLELSLTGLTTSADISAAIDAYFAPGGGFETNIYQGGAPGAQPELASGRQLTTLPTADDDTLRNLLRGLTMVAFNTRVEFDQRTAFLRDGAEVVESAREAMIAQEASIGLDLNTLDLEIERIDREVFNAQTTLDNLLGRDPFEAASETQSLEARLQASYTVVARVSALRLANFL